MNWCERGYHLDIRRPCLGEALPETLAEHDGAVIFGGPMSANDPDDWIAREIDWIGVALKEEKPFLGVCLGAQMLCQAAGRHGLARIPMAGRDRLLSAPARADQGKMLRSLARTCLSLASRGLFLAAGGRAPGDRRDLREPGLPLRKCGLGHPVPPGSDAPHDAPLGRSRRASIRAAQRADPRPPIFDANLLHDAAVKRWLTAVPRFTGFSRP